MLNKPLNCASVSLYLFPRELDTLHIDSPIQQFRDLTEQGAGSSICLPFRLLRSRTGGQWTRRPLQLFANLDGEAIQVVLLMPDRIRERWKDFVDELSAYYNTPGRLAVFRRKFENVHRRPGLDPATFAMELGSRITRIL